MEEWKSSIDKRDFKDLNIYAVKIDSSINKLKIKYGEENLSNFITKLNVEEKIILGEHDLSPCTKNLDGTIYTGACSLWGKIKFYLSLECSGLPKDNAKQIEALFDCYQKDICSICS